VCSFSEVSQAVKPNIFSHCCSQHLPPQEGEAKVEVSSIVLSEASFGFFSMIQDVLHGPIPLLKSTSLSVEQSGEVHGFTPLQM